MREAAVPTRYRLRVQERLLVLEYASANGVRPASRRFGFTSRTIRRWRARWRADGIGGLIPRYPVDVTFVRVGPQRLFQNTALDDCTRYRVLHPARVIRRTASPRSRPASSA